MSAPAQDFANEIAELREIAADYRRMSRDRAAEMVQLRKQRRELVDLCIQFNDVDTLAAIIDHLEKSIVDFERWPAASRD